MPDLPTILILIKALALKWHSFCEPALDAALGILPQSCWPTRPPVRDASLAFFGQREVRAGGVCMACYNSTFRTFLNYPPLWLSISKTFWNPHLLVFFRW